MSATDPYFPSLASIVHDIIMDLSDTVGELVSASVVYSLWDLLSAHPLAFNDPSHFHLGT